MSRITLRAASLRPDLLGDGLILRLRDTKGRLGLGEAVARPGFSPPLHALQQSAKASQLTEKILGRSFACIQEVEALSAEICATDDTNPLPSPLRFALDSALLDLLGQARGCTVATLLGEPAPQIRRNALVQLGTDRHTIENLQGRGFTTIKVKAHGPWPRSLHRLEALALILAECSPAIGLRIDCNRSIPLERAPGADARVPNCPRSDDDPLIPLKRASKLLQGLAKLAPEYVEEPFEHLDATALRVLQSADLALAIDESGVDPRAWREHLDAGVAVIAVIKPAFVGGLFAALKRVQEARARGLKVVITSALEGSIGVAAAAHLALAIRPTLAVGISARTGTNLPPWLAADSPIVRHAGSFGLGIGDPGGFYE